MIIILSWGATLATSTLIYKQRTETLHHQIHYHKTSDTANLKELQIVICQISLIINVSWWNSLLFFFFYFDAREHCLQVFNIRSKSQEFFVTSQKTFNPVSSRMNSMLEFIEFTSNFLKI